ncbi:MAG: VWA domain-containing protein [Gammaproteobacteria bacterium]|jgi:Mg-chelatase subunit ChlD|nr:VWA domain-containing protein [Gammaproteobacteria bacterium]
MTTWISQFHFHHTVLAALLVAAAPLLSPSAAARDSGPQSILILDGSGSMWGQIDGVAKIEIARDAIDRMLADWPAERELGLMAYGHRREGDCSDIEVLAEPASVDRAAFNAMTEAVSPRGKTPIGAAVERAAQTLAADDRPATVIVVTDGRETCQADLCELGATLEQSGAAFTAHVIGFDVDDESGELACLASETGGRFIAASDAESLASALQVAREETEPEMSPAQVDDFERDTLGSSWQIVRPEPSAFLLENGELLTMTVEPGAMGSDEAANIFRWVGAELPDGDFAIAADFTARMGEVQTLGGRRAVVQVGRYQDAENYIAVEIARQGNSNDDMWLRLRVVTGGSATVEEVEIAGDVRGYDLAQILDDFENKGARLTLVKRGRDYIGRLETPGWTLQPDGPDSIETEPVTVLRSQGAPALFAGTRGPEQTLVMFDRIELAQTTSAAE